MRTSVLLSVFVVSILAVLGIGYLALPGIVSVVVKDYLSDQGFKGAMVSVEKIGLTRAEIVDLDLGPTASLSVARVTVNYSLSRLADGFIDGVELDGAELGLRVDASGLSLGTLDDFLSPAEATGDSPQMRLVGPVVVKGGRLLIATPVGTVAASVDGEVLLTDGLGTKLNAAISLDHERAQLGGRINGVIDDADQVRLDVEIETARSDARLAFSEMVGAITVEGTLSSAFDGGGSLTVQNASFDGLPIGNMDVAGSLEGTSAHLEMLLDGEKTGLTLQSKIDVPNIFVPSSPVRVAGDIATDGLRGAFALPDNVGLIGAATFLFEGSQADFRGLPAYFTTGRPLPNAGVSGIVDADLLSIELPSQKVSATIDGATSFLVDNRAIQARAVDDLALNVSVATDERDYVLRTTVSPIESVPFVAVGPGGQQPVDVGMTFDGAVDGFGKVSGALGGNLWLGDAEGLAFENFSVQLNPMRTRAAGLDIALSKLVTRLAGPARAPVIGIEGDILFSGEPAPGLSLTGGGATFATRLQLLDQSIALYGEGCPEVRLSTLSFDGTKIRPGLARICPISDTTPLLRVVSEKGEAKRIDGAGVISGIELQADGIGPYPVAGLLPRLETRVSYGLKDRTWWGQFEGTGGDLKVEGPDLALSGVTLTAELEGKSRLLGARVKLKSGKIVDQRRPIRFQPLGVSAGATWGADALDFETTVSVPNGPVVTSRGRHRPAEGRGNVTVNLPRWYAEPENTIVSDALPILKGLITGVTGGFEGEARWDWTSRGSRSNARLLIENGGFASVPVEVRGINGTLNLDDVLAPKSDGVQTFSLGLVDAGFPLENGHLEFELAGDNLLRINKVSWPFAGGRIGAENVRVPFDRLPDSVTATISNVDATALVNLADVADLNAEGVLEGTVPILLGEEGVVIDDAQLSSIGGGVLRYRSASAAESLKQSGGSAEILARALQDFRFEDLSIRLNGPLDGEIVAKAQINGANPALYDGKRIELNVSLQGALREFLQSANVVRNIPETIRDRVQGPTGN